MSYEIVKKIRIDGNKVFITSDSNNVFPKYYKERENQFCTEILQNKGMEALNLDLLKAYESGEFQPGIENKWSRAITRLKNTEEYKKYNWRISDYSDNCPIQAARKTKEFDELLLNSLTLKPPTEKYILKKDAYGTEYFIYKVTSRHIKFRQGRENAKVFQFKQQAERIAEMFPEYQLISL